MKNHKVSVALSMLILGCGLFAKDGETVRLDQIVTTATMTEASVVDVPSTMEIITAEEIKKTGAKSVFDVLRNQSFNIGVQSIAGQAINMRGFGSSHTLVLINGRRPAGFGSIGENNGKIIRDIDANAIERIEIIRGSAGALYGSNASAGIINIITKKSQEKSFTATLSGGAFESSGSILADLGTFGEDNKWDAIFNAKYTKFYGEEDEYDKDDIEEKLGYSETRGKSIYLNTDIGYKINQDHEIRLFAEFSDEEKPRDNFTPSTTSGGGGGGGSGGGATLSDSGGVTTTNHTQRYIQRVGTAIDYFGNIGDHSINVSTSINKTFDDVFATDETYSYTYYNLKATDTWMANEYNLVTFGVDAILNKVSNDNYKDDEQTILAAFVQDELTLFDNYLYIIPAIRVEEYSTFGSSITPNIGATLNFTENSRLKISYGLGYRAPELVELFGEVSESQGRRIILGNENLKEEESKNFEVRYELNLQKFDIALGYYHSKIDNLISDRGLTVGNPCGAGVRECYIQENIEGESTIQGFEFEASYDIGEYFTLSGNYNYFDGKEEDGTPLVDFAEQTTSARISYDNPALFYAALSGKYYDHYIKAESNVANQIPIDFWTTDLFISKTWKEKYTLTISLNDIVSSDENYYNNKFIDTNWDISFSMKF